MGETVWQGRKAFIVEAGKLRLVYLPGGGHVAALELAEGPAAGLNPLWEPPWPSLEPADYDAARDDPPYGGPPEGRLLASIRGHNLCVPWFGPPLPGEAERGLGVHGEAPLARWAVREVPGGLESSAELPLTGFAMRRRISIRPGSAVVGFETETVNRAGNPQPLGWQEHVSLGPPFLEGGITLLDHPGRRSVVMPAYGGHHRLRPDAEFEWPAGPGADGKNRDLRTFTTDSPRGDFTSHLMGGDTAWFTAVNPRLNLLLGYAWNPADFPWLGIWTESRSMHTPPWNSRTVSCGMEFGLSPWPRRPLPERVLGAPTLGRLESGAGRTAAFRAFLAAVPSGCSGVRAVRLQGDSILVSLLFPSTTITIS